MKSLSQNNNSESGLERRCIRCNKMKSYELYRGTSTCITCLDRKNQLRKIRRERKTISGERICAKCQKSKPDIEFKLGNRSCESCLTVDRNRRNHLINQVVPDGKRTCRQCLTVLDTELFLGDNNSCISCGEKTHNRWVEIATERINIRKSGCCSICGEDDWRVLEFDHIIPGIKGTNISWCRSKTYLATESAKTRLLCKICHRIHTTIQAKKSGDANESQLSKYVHIRKMKRLKLYEYVNTIKCKLGCSDCGYTNYDYPSTLEFDHIDGVEKVYCISQLIANVATIDIIDTEIGKCVVRCCNCHFIRTINQMGYYKYINDV